MLTASLTDITEELLTGLIELGAGESQTLDFKRTAYALQKGATQEQQLDCLKDFLAFANADGGDIVLGVEQDDRGRAVALSGMEESVGPRGIDGFIQRVEQLIYHHSDPPLVGVRWKEVRLRDGKVVLVARIPRSPSSPHRARLEDNRFWMRQERNNRVMDTAALRSLILGQEITFDRIESFREQRRDRLCSDGHYFRDAAGAIIVVHCIPWHAFGRRGTVVDLARVEAEKECSCPMQTRPQYVSSVYSLDGLRYSMSPHRPGASVVTLFRNGIVESAAGFRLEDPNLALVDGDQIERELVGAVWRGLQLQAKLEVLPPTVAVVTVVGRGAIRLGYRDDFIVRKNDLGEGTWPQESFALPEVVIDRLPPSLLACKETIASSIAVMWQAAGYTESAARCWRES